MDIIIDSYVIVDVIVIIVVVTPPIGGENLFVEEHKQLLHRFISVKQNLIYQIYTTTILLEVSHSYPGLLDSSFWYLRWILYTSV